MPKKTFTILQFMAENIINLNTSSNAGFSLTEEISTSANYIPPNTFSLTEQKRYIINPLVLSLDRRALFLQILDELNISEIELEYNSDVLRKKILFVDFSQASGKSNIFHNEALHKKAELLFLKGFDIIFEDNTIVHFEHFERSNSMSKKNIVSFISSNIKHQLSKRIYLDLKLQSNYVINKLYAYAGLMLSSGVNVGSALELGLNNESVVIVDDFEKDMPDCEYITLTENAQNANTTKVEHSNENPAIETIKYKASSKKVKIKPYDGVGLIDAAFAHTINKIYFEENDRSTSSYQIRLPFVKGMLHSCNLKEFFSYYLGEDGTITDIAGRPHKCDNIKIILTKSQFKAFSFMDTDSKSEVGKQLEFYWEKVHYYNHRLFITDIGATKNSKFISTNYQFLSTANMTQVDFGKIIEPTKIAYNNLANNIDDRIAFLKDLRIDTLLLQKSEQVKSTIAPTYIEKLVRKNENFVYNSRIKNIIDDKLKSFEKDFKLCKFYLQGERRYLCGDLMQLLHDIIDINLPDDDKLNVDCFYAPSPTHEYVAEECYTLLRNPHLSRNEYGMLKAHIAQDNCVRNNLFGHLSNVIMVNSLSLISDRLSGADYDGDQIIIVQDETFNACTLKNYSCSSSAEFKASKNKYPVILIPKLSAKAVEINDENKLEAIKASFSLNIGEINNKAFCFAVNAFNENFVHPERNVLSEKTAVLALLTGLEIDSAKTGQKKEIGESLKKSKYPCSEYGEKFIKFKNKVEENKTPDKFAFTEKDNLPNLLTIINTPISTTAIEKIRQPKNLQLFEFDKKQPLKGEIVEKVKALYSAYNSTITFIHMQNKNSDNETFLLYKTIIESTLTITNKDAALFSYIMNKFSYLDIKNIDSILNDMREKKWHFMAKCDRSLFLKDNFPQIDDITCEILCDFTYKGYMLLFLFMSCLKISLKSVENKEDDDTHIESLSLIDSYKKRLKSAYNDSKQIATIKKTSLEAVTSKARDILINEIFKDEPSPQREALRYCVTIRNSNISKSNFMWELLPDEILEYSLNGKIGG